MVKWTKEQEAAIYATGKDTLIAAAAGSGKTAVLVERIIQKVISKENPTDIDSLLVVTFTNAAAEEMRNRVAEALEQEIAKDPASTHLKKQLSLLQRASISTLHSFCMNVVREYAYLLDIDPAFRIANDVETDLIKQDTLDDLFEEWYGKEGEDRELFLDFIERFSNDRNDREVEALVLSLYTFAMQNPWPELWLDELLANYQIVDDWQEEDFAWLNLMKDEMRFELEAVEQELELAINLANDPEGPAHYVEAIENDQQQINKIKENISSWQDLQPMMTSLNFKRLSTKKYECDEEKKERTKKHRDAYKKRLEDIKKKWFIRDLASHVEDMRKLYPVFEQLISFVKEFQKKYTKEKQERAIVDFSDLEHYCLDVLVEEDTTYGELKPSFVAQKLKEKYTELLVDEYQDTNLVQETILQLIRRPDPGNMFMVGDVKQSIYRFRHAEPTLFIEKYKRYADEPEVGKRIDLARNFRSRENVLIGVNYIFRQLMDEKLGEIAYDQDAELIYANHLYDQLPMLNSEPELVMINSDNTSSSNEDEAEQLEKAQLEARQYAKLIKAWIGDNGEAPIQVIDKATQQKRNVRFSDIVILHRSLTWAGVIMEEFKKQNLPIYTELSTGYFEAIEIKIMISFLKVIDNPRQDIPLASVLRSPIVGLDEEELTQIRLAKPGVDFYEALLVYKKQVDENHQLHRFLNMLEVFRVQSRQGALSELIWQIYRETGYYDFAGGMPGGRQRQANLRALYDRARTYEQTSFRGLFRFLRLIERMEERGEDLGAASALSEKEDVVRIMTIHSSKGLEFPVVILGGLGRQFNMMDLRSKYLIDKDYGFATQFINPVKRISYPTLYYHAVKNIKLRQLLAEEMRVLYVALTRAKEKLVMVGTVTGLESKIEKWQETINHDKWVLPSHIRVVGKSYIDWIGPALMRHQHSEALRTESFDLAPTEIINDPSSWNFSVVEASELTKVSELEEVPEEALKQRIVNWKIQPLENNELTALVDHRLTYQYPFEEAVRARAKQTVTEIKRQREQRDDFSADQLIAYRTPIVKRPSFMQKEKKVTAAERGTAMHTVMQHLPLDKEWTREGLRQFLDVLVRKEIIHEDMVEHIHIPSILKFLETEIAHEIRQAETVYREVPFSIALSAKDVYKNWNTDKEEKVLIQGVIDCLIPKEDGWMMIDYKTDAIFDEITEELKHDLFKRYETQISLYRQAVETIWQQPVKEAYLYFFSKSVLISCN